MINLLTIVSITKDDLEGIRRTIASTKNLREVGWVSQIIVDSSSEAIYTKVCELEKESNLTILHHPEPGISVAFNIGWQNSNSVWIWFLNGGDEAHPLINLDFLKSLLQSTQSEAIIFELEIMTNGVVTQRPSLWNLWPPLNNWIPHPSTLMRRETLARANGFDPQYKVAMDYDMWIRVFGLDVKVDLISIPLACYEGNGISSDFRNTAPETTKIIKNHLKLLFKRWLQQGYIIPYM